MTTLRAFWSYFLADGRQPRALFDRRSTHGRVYFEAFVVMFAAVLLLGYIQQQDIIAARDATIARQSAEIAMRDSAPIDCPAAYNGHKLLRTLESNTVITRPGQLVVGCIFEGEKS